MNDHRDELGRPSTWVLAVAAGLFVIALNMVGDIGADISRPAALHVWRGVMAFAATLGLAHGGLGLLRGLLLVLESWPQAQPEPAPITPPPAPIPVLRQVRYNVAGREKVMELHDTKSPRWLDWNNAAWQMVAWYELRRSLAADSLCPGAFADKTAWVRFTDVMRDAGLVLKDRSGTFWRHPLGAIKAQLERGVIDWPDTDPPKIHPCPSAPVTVDAAPARTQT